ncbi:MAG: diguanylate cyclase, partial [Acinetobacter sp.]|nr:diguanylate cyclase [Acinetobacter sp.]
RRSVESLIISDDIVNTPTKVTISIGVSKNDTADEVMNSSISRADEYMREAKKSGKNTVRPIFEGLAAVIQSEIGRSYSY